MGYYINPDNGTKESFLAAHGTPIDRDDAVINAESLPVALIDQFRFTAAAICFSQQELEYFKSAYPFETVRFFQVPRESLREWYS